MNENLIIEPISSKQQDFVKDLESGKIIFLPEHKFALKNHESVLLNANILASGKKNISYDFAKKKMRHIASHYRQTPTYGYAEDMLNRYALFAKNLIDALCPDYQEHLLWGRTSYRPVEISNRKVSVLKNDQLLHVDAFKSMPVKGQRILRVFTNINPEQKPRVWHIGEDFPDVLRRFEHKIKPYSSLKAAVLAFFKLTKSKRSAYDHCMLELHNHMKLDKDYQTAVKKLEFKFPAQSSWIVFTDQVSHAALSGQYLLEQTFYLPMANMLHHETAPLSHWQSQRPQVRNWL